MKLATRNFGEIEIDETKLITFQDGIPGFLNYKKYILLTNDEEDNNTIWWLQSSEDGEVAFPVLNTFSVLPEYRPEIDDELLGLLGQFKSEQDLIVCNILVVPEDVTQMRVNLKAPIVINIITQKGMQAVVNNNEYEIRHNVYEEIKKYLEKEGE